MHRPVSGDHKAPTPLLEPKPALARTKKPLDSLVQVGFPVSIWKYMGKSKAGGQIDRSTILKAMKIDSATFSKVVRTLHMCDMIEEESLSRRKTVYTLKTAA